MGRRMRWQPLGLVSIVGVNLQCYMFAWIALFVLSCSVSASISFEEESRGSPVSSGFEIARCLMQTAWEISITFKSNADAWLRNAYWRVTEGRWRLSEIVWGGALVCAIQALILWRMTAAASKSETKDQPSGDALDRPSTLWAAWRINPEMEAQLTDPGLLQKFSTFKSYTTSKAVYPSIRTFYRAHSQADKLPNKPTPLPLLVFVHGLGGCLASFTPILTSLINIAPCLGIDFPGCGRSAFSPTSWDAYTPNALAELLRLVIEQHASGKESQGVIFIGHSMGCSLSLLTAISQIELSGRGQNFEVLALIGVCPPAEPPYGKTATRYRRFLKLPTWIFDILRALDRRKGLDSASVVQFTGKNADTELRRIQVKYNRQSRTPVFRRMALGALSNLSGPSFVRSSLPGLDAWSKLKIPIFLVAGEGDTVTKPEEVTKIAQALGKISTPSTASPSKGSRGQDSVSGGSKDQANPRRERQSIASTTEVTILDSSHDSHEQSLSSSLTYSRKRQVLKTSILPYPASHALLYDPSLYRTLAGLIQTFLSDHVDTRLSLGWQLQHLSTEGKWDVKNLAKWKAVEPVSEPIAGIFRAMKTLREIDNSHSPEQFVTQWKGKIKAVIDISHESPVYDPKGLDEGGIEYHKFPTVSKIPPTVEETKDFIKLVDKLREQPPVSSDESSALIGVHCHYGFNRTGFFICCYLIEKEKYGVQQAIDAFAQGRPKGIKHAHFLDQLFVRYCVGLKRAPTL